MKDLGKSIVRYKNGGAIFGFWLILLATIFFIGFYISIGVLKVIEVDEMGQMMALVGVAIFTCLTIYMYFKSKTEMDIREKGIYVRTTGKKHEILYNEIASFDKTRRVGKNGPTVIVFYLLVIVTKNGERITFPCRIGEEFIQKLLEVSQLS